ncbi:hypothetical protein QVD99_008287 [Batrachochytrium dendrobatidis]|uniref:G-protein coupled receptors family 1 profile domain-containing protein n=1 Tax=Batrachochytrium dendrobatidis (strain JEL423) TaxID=403673 RepID=A0A177WUA9_BATDL|nr:hypothetical protein QVD99_008287 [Batrachochytrium dendrobatidis]OAJ43698.1 hypothetical protein BDEG_27030 [Batrachochytrium dendrobatidis JEL423]OAJ43699.1 hypothetical protein, variant [Batrachochytrium dendrobatidis JEL423]
MSYVATLATESCIFSSIVIYGAGVALSNVKSVAGGVTVIVSTVSFLITQILILAVSERLPYVYCHTANDVIYTFSILFRLSILYELHRRAEVVSRQNVWFKAVTYLSTVLGVISIILFIYQFASSPYIPNTCTPNLNKTMVHIGYSLLATSFLFLNIIMIIPTIRVFCPSAVSSSNSLHVQTQTKILINFLNLAPSLTCLLLVFLSLFPPDPSNWFGLFSVLALSDFCQIWLLLFPNVVRISNITSISNVSTTNVPSCQRSQGPNPPRDSNVLA